MTGRARPRIGYLTALMAPAAGELLRPPRRVFGPAVTEPAGTGLPVPGPARQPDDVGRPSAAGAPRSAGAADWDQEARSAEAAGWYRDRHPPGPPRPGADGLPAGGPTLARRPASAPATEAGWPDPAAARARLPVPGLASLTGDGALTGDSSSGPPAGPGQKTAGYAGGYRGRPADHQLPGPATDRRGPGGPAAGQQGAAGPPGSRQPLVPSGAPLAPAANQAPGLSIGTIEVTILPPPAAVPQPAARATAVRPPRPQPERLSRGYGPRFGQGQ